MRHLLALPLFLTTLVGAFAQPTMVPPSQLRKSLITGALACWPQDVNGPADCGVVQFDSSIVLDRSTNPPTMRATSSQSNKYVGGKTGTVVTNNTVSPPEIDIVTTVVPQKNLSEEIDGLWTYKLGVMLPPSSLPVCDSTTNAGRLMTDVVDGDLKFCNGSWQPIIPHAHWRFRTSATVLTSIQISFNILDPTIVPGSLVVTRNGVTMNPGTDYTQATPLSPVVFAVGQIPQITDTIILRYMY